MFCSETNIFGNLGNKGMKEKLRVLVNYHSVLLRIFLTKTKNIENRKQKFCEIFALYIIKALVFVSLQTLDLITGFK